MKVTIQQLYAKNLLASFRKEEQEVQEEEDVEIEEKVGAGRGEGAGRGSGLLGREGEEQEGCRGWEEEELNGSWEAKAVEQEGRYWIKRS